MAAEQQQLLEEGLAIYPVDAAALKRYIRHSQGGDVAGSESLKAFADARGRGSSEAEASLRLKGKQQSLSAAAAPRL